MATSKQDIIDFYNQLARVSAQHEEDMTVLRSKLDSLLQDWPTTPPPPTAAPGLRFAVHKYDNTTPVDFSAASFYDLQRGYRVGATPRSTDQELYLYVTMVKRPGDENGYTQFLKPSVILEEWLAHFKAEPWSHVTRSINGGDTLINISNAQWQAKAIANVVSEVLAHNATGLYLDEVDWSLSFGWPIVKDHPCLEFPSDREWRAALLQFVQRLAGELHVHGKKLWINHGANAWVDPEWHNNILRSVDAVNSEFFIGREGVGDPPAKMGNGWEEQTSYVAEAEKLGLAAHVRCSSTNQSVVDYAFLSWLAVTSFRGSFSASSNYAGPIARPSMELLSKAYALGRPIAGYASSAYGYYRQFEKGVVRVNPFLATKNGMLSGTGSIVLQS